MSGQRKLQQEMDKVFKKILEGLEIFDTLYERHQNASNSSQKDKLENDLKKEIKKLQRFREQVKNWQAANEIKDKNQLLEHRRLVEVAMEKYKVVEKGSKTKAYSDQSLAAVEKPQIENEAVEFVRQALDSLQQQTEALESEIEKLQPTKKGKKNFHNEELKKELDELLASHQWHTEKLEIILRLLQNEVLKVDDVMDISDDITYYLDENRSPDFMFDDSIYDELDLEADQALINDIHVIDSSYTESSDSQIPEQKIPQPKSRSSIPNLNSNTSSRSNSVQKSSSITQSNTKQEKPPVIQQQSFAIGTSSITNQPTMTTLKPAPVPNLPAEIKWSSLVTEVKKSDPSTPTTTSTSSPPNNSISNDINNDNDNQIKLSPQNFGQQGSPSPTQKSVELQSQQSVNDVALNAVSVLETLKKQKPKDASIPSTSENSDDIPNFLQTPQNVESVPTSVDQSEEKTELTIPEIADDVTSIKDFRFLPSGVQSFILSIVSNKDIPNKTYNPFQMLNHTPNQTYPSGPKANKLFESWSQTNTKVDLLDAVSKIEDNEILFYGYYYGRSLEERNVCKDTLFNKGWKESISKENWYLSNKIASSNDDWSIGDYNIFNTDKWCISEKKNFKLENNKLLS